MVRSPLYLWVQRLQVESGGTPLVDQRLNRDDRFDGTCSAQQMTEVAFRAAHGQSIRPPAKHRFDRLCLYQVPDRGGCRVCIQVADVGRGGASQRHPHRSHRPISIRRWGGDMVCIPSGSIAHDLGQNRRPAVDRLLSLFQDHDACAFAHHEASPGFIKRPRERRHIFPFPRHRQRTKLREPRNAQRVHLRVHASGKHGGRHPQADEVVRVADGVRPRGARRGHSMAGPPQVEPSRNRSRSAVRKHSGHEEGVHSPGASLRQLLRIQRHISNRRHPDTHADAHLGATDLKLRSLDSLHRRQKGQLHEARLSSSLLRRQDAAFQGLRAHYDACKAAGKLREVRGSPWCDGGQDICGNGGVFDALIGEQGSNTALRPEETFPQRCYGRS
mmetsp:Transcript_10094/g.38226  ORF Transcript_10094/g.38226 Transcript_10094/m.38226 type:complete len:387 (+) Transcript_10094:1347-2507(+)